MNSVRVVHSRVFAATPGGGNPCPVVVEGAGLSDEAMLGLARRYGLDTVFVLPPQRDGDIRMRYFVPDHELGVSGHATIAGITVATNGKEWPARPMRVETIDGVFEVTRHTRDSDIEEAGQRQSRRAGEVDPTCRRREKIGHV